MKHIVFHNGDLILDQIIYALANFSKSIIVRAILALTATADEKVIEGYYTTIYK